MRAVKTPLELDRLAAISRATQRAVLLGLGDSRLGESERDWAWHIQRQLIDGGATSVRFVYFACGPNSSMTMPRDRIPREGEILRLDAGGNYGPWGSDFGRTYSTGDPSARQRRAYAALRQIYGDTIDRIRPGQSIEKTFHYCQRACAKAGYTQILPAIGHSLGLEPHEQPWIREGETRRFQPGMAFNIEPVIVDQEGSSYQFEDLFVVTETGAEVLTLDLPPAGIPIVGEAAG